VLLTSAAVPLAKAMIGETYTPLDNANARVGIGDSTTAANKGQTDLQAAANKIYLPMDATFPTRDGAEMTFQVTVTEAFGNYVWNEFLLSDGLPGTAWARFVQQLNGGVAKASGQIWILQVTAVMGRNDAAN
jgi:hypothetical protein